MAFLHGQRLGEEMAVMRALPERRMESAKRERVKVDAGSLIYVDRNVYSVPSRLIGEQVEARLYMDQGEVWYGQKVVAEMPRLRGRSSIAWTTGHRLAGAQAGCLGALPGIATSCSRPAGSV